MAEKISGPKGLTQDELIRAGYDLCRYGLFERGRTYMAMGAAALGVFIGAQVYMQTDRTPESTSHHTRFDPPGVDVWKFPEPQVHRPADEYHRPAQQMGLEVSATEQPG